MPDLGGIYADTYRIPVQQGGGAAAYQQPGQQPFDDGIQFEKNLQEVEGKTRAYYEKVAALKSFMLDMHRNRGIDVRVPDLANPDSIKLNEIYKRGLADIMHQGNLLSVGEGERRMNLQQGAIYNPSAKGKADSELGVGSDIFSHTVPNNIIEVNNQLQQPSYTDEEYSQKLESYNKINEHLDEMIKDQPENARMYEHWRSALTKPSKTQKQWAPQRLGYAERSHARKVEAAGNLPVELTHIFQGANDNSSVSPTQTNPDVPGNPLMISPNFKGSKFGGKVIKEWGHDPKTNQTFLFFEDGSQQEVTRENPMSLSRVLLGSNPGTYGFDEENIEEWADKHGYFDASGQFNQGAVLRKDAAQVKQNKLAEFEKDQTKARYQTLKDKLQAVKSGTSYLLGTRSSGTFRLANKAVEAVVKKAKGSGNLYIDNFIDLFPPPSDKKKQAAYKAMALTYGPDGDGVDVDEMTKFMHKYGASQNLGSTTVESGETASEAVKESAKDKAARLIREAKGSK